MVREFVFPLVLVEILSRVDSGRDENSIGKSRRMPGKAEQGVGERE